MIVTDRISFQSKGYCDIVDITHEVAKRVVKAQIDSGAVTLFVAGSTAGITTIEFEPGLVSDFKEMWQQFAPDNISYNHNRAWDDDNGYSHVRASLLGASLVIPFQDKILALGTWQQVVLVDFDNRPRSRRVVVQIMGES